ncbi:kinesin-like protein KIN-5C [Hyalella azteca]|uniref:Kinesin-like protein KIN-5C n=1 Tax=Hyalella azteca TaxID=294128 RepID=A0A8B7PHE8_HYAAZ|nr:kinesin-like protein KIN-5C [Hyalella azteca]
MKLPWPLCWLPRLTCARILLAGICKFRRDQIVCTKFQFVDLAGSECVKETGADEKQRKEAISINMGLLALGQVVRAHAAKLESIPYRDSKLTHLLKDSIGGRSRCLTMACISPAHNCLPETSRTIDFADQARQINYRSKEF